MWAESPKMPFFALLPFHSFCCTQGIWDLSTESNTSGTVNQGWHDTHQSLNNHSAAALEKRKGNLWGIMVATFPPRREGLMFLTYFIARNQIVLFNLSNITRLAFNVSRNTSENIRYTFCYSKDMQTSVLLTTRDSGSPLSPRGQHLNSPTLRTQELNLKSYTCTLHWRYLSWPHLC